MSEETSSFLQQRIFPSIEEVTPEESLLFPGTKDKPLLRSGEPDWKIMMLAPPLLTVLKEAQEGARLFYKTEEELFESIQSPPFILP